MLYSQIITTKWQSIDVNETADSNRLKFRKPFPITDREINSELSVHFVNIDCHLGLNLGNDKDSEIVQQINSVNLTEKACNEFPFYFKVVKSAIEVHFSLQHEIFKPKRFTRKQLNDSDGFIRQPQLWYRPSKLFTLEENDTAVFRVNYYCSNRTLAGATKRPFYLRFDVYFANVKTLTPSVFANAFTFVKDETIELR